MVRFPIFNSVLSIVSSDLSIFSSINPIFFAVMYIATSSAYCSILTPFSKSFPNSLVYTAYNNGLNTAPYGNPLFIILSSSSLSLIITFVILFFIHISIYSVIFARHSNLSNFSLKTFLITLSYADDMSKNTATRLIL